MNIFEESLEGATEIEDEDLGAPRWVLTACRPVLVGMKSVAGDDRTGD